MCIFKSGVLGCQSVVLGPVCGARGPCYLGQSVVLGPVWGPCLGQSVVLGPMLSRPVSLWCWGQSAVQATQTGASLVLLLPVV